MHGSSNGCAYRLERLSRWQRACSIVNNLRTSTTEHHQYQHWTQRTMGDLIQDRPIPSALEHKTALMLDALRTLIPVLLGKSEHSSRLDRPGDGTKLFVKEELTEEMRELQEEAGEGWGWTRVGDRDVERRVELHSGGSQDGIQRVDMHDASFMPFIKEESSDLLCRTDIDLENTSVRIPTTKHHQTGDNNSNQQPNLATRPPTPDIWLFKLCGPRDRRYTRKERATIFKTQKRVDAALSGFGPCINIARSLRASELNLTSEQETAIAVAQEKLTAVMQWRRQNWGSQVSAVKIKAEMSPVKRRAKAQARNQRLRGQRPQIHAPTQPRPPTQNIQHTSRSTPTTSPPQQHPIEFIFVPRVLVHESGINRGQPRKMLGLEKIRHRIMEQERLFSEYRQWYQGLSPEMKERRDAWLAKIEAAHPRNTCSV